MGMRLAAAALLATLLSGCSVSVGEDTRPAGCETFDRIAVEIETQGPRADVGNQLRQIEREARTGGARDVTDAAEGLLAAAGGAESDWYAALGKMEAACAGQRP